jgi:secreted trypsin-like serine protease
MKLIVAAVFAVLAISAHAEISTEPMANWEIDYENVLPVTDMPGFWDGREIRPAFYPGDATRQGRIVGGVISTPNQWPFQVGLFMQFGGGTGLCGGSRLSTRAVLTAAHCPIGSSSTQLVFGAHQITVVEPTQVRHTAPSGNYRLHAGYNPSNLNNDIAIIITTAVIGGTAQIANIALAPAGAGTFAGSTAVTSGWGRITNTGGTSPVLRHVERPVITNAVCAATYGGTIIASTICISTTGGQGTCNGDSGGPLTIPVGGGRQQIGVVSFGAAAGCQAGFPAGFARVSSFAAWITTNSQP